MKIDMKSLNFEYPPNGRDVSNIGHYGTGNFELTITKKEDLSDAKSWIKKSFVEIGG